MSRIYYADIGTGQEFPECYRFEALTDTDANIRAKAISNTVSGDVWNVKRITEDTGGECMREVKLMTFEDVDVCEILNTTLIYYRHDHKLYVPIQLLFGKIEMTIAEKVLR